MQEHRKRLHSAIKIQAYIRSYLVRKHYKDYEREQFDSMFLKLTNDNLVTTSIVAKILFFYDAKKDSSRLVRNISQILIYTIQIIFESCNFTVYNVLI